MQLVIYTGLCCSLRIGEGLLAIGSHRYFLSLKPQTLENAFYLLKPLEIVLSNSITLTKFSHLIIWAGLFGCLISDGTERFVLFTGYYLLANTKFTSQPGYIGRLYGPSLPGNLQYCLRFYYAIYGFLKMSDTLAVYIFEENHMVQEKIWSVLESPRGVWMQAEITFKKPMSTKVQ